MSANKSRSPSGSSWRRLSEIKRAIQLGGGFRRTLWLLSHLWITEGWQGYAWRIRLVRNSAATGPQSTSINDYRSWYHRHDSLDPLQRRALVSDMQTWSRRPLISVLMPVFNPRLEWLEQAVQSVRAQAYPDWELCIADDASTHAGVRTLLQSLARQEPRIKLAFREKNGHICAASNTALEMAGGEFVALLDHDDLLPPQALYWVARAALAHPNAGLIYSDEDKIDEKGRRSAPYFKPAFNYDLFLSQNMVSHLGVFRRALVETVGRFREGLEGSQDYDLALRCVEQLRAEQIVHIPRVLYHWRLHGNSTAQNMAAKPYAAAAGELALNAHLARLSQKGAIRYAGYGYQYLPAPMEGPQRISILVYLRTEAAVHPVSMAAHLREATDHPILEFLWVLCPSLTVTEESRLAAQLSASGNRYFGSRHGLTIASRVNAAAQSAAGEQLVLLLGGAQPRHPEWLAQLATHAMRAGVGVAGARLWDHNGTLIQAGLFVNGAGALASGHYGQAPQYKGYFGRSALNQSFHAVSAACIAVRHSLFDSVGGLAPGWKTMRYAVADLCLRLSAQGHRTLWTPDVNVKLPRSAHDERWHAGGQVPEAIEDAGLWSRQWGRITEDAHYNPNLSWERPHFELASPPRGGTDHAAGTAPDGVACVFRTAPYAATPWAKASL
ncbi:glycosyltransferase family 2 protein [Ottowia sp. VDI28]|uniref:glycosyltransferase family 2 protein n=1 Tax=Ottowia sp. VDI28 TaxID=3133968 RepID=UPI003C2FDD78